MDHARLEAHFEFRNTTVKCDERVSTLIGSGIDNNYWYMDNLTRLCTADCQASLHSWGNSVESACYGQTIWQSGAQVQAKALTHSFTHNADIACMKDSHSNWCFFESQSWQGSDYIRWDPLLCADLEDLPPQCNDSTFDPDEISPDMSALTNLYDSKLRLLDPWLSQSNFTDYLIGEFDDLQRKCSTTLPYSTSSSTLYIGSATSTPTTINSTTGAPSATPTCIGQLVQPKDDFLTCNDLSDTYGVSTGDARVATGDFVCQFTSTICLPLPCKLDTVWDSPSCSDLARRYSNSTYNVTQAQFLSWNSNIQGSCDGVALGQRVCKGAPGGTFPQPRPSITAPGATGTAVYYTAATAAYPTQIGSIKECGNYYLVQPGDNCQTVAIQFGLNFSQLQEYNTYLYNNCSNLWKDYDVCVAPVMPQTVSQNGTCPPGVTCVGSAFGECQFADQMPDAVPHLAIAEATPAIALHREMARRRLMVRADRITGARLAQTRRLEIAAASTAIVALGLTSVVLAIATRGTAPQILAALRQMVNVALILQETRPAPEHSLELVAQGLDTVVLRMIIV
ncbi:hypothetical protein PFICI_11228 [Pestalotiopsis fici W106-1]|uniref:LysM domain-containing protein n=1 Tax=Pestalotiopsis fici (strain W106-1 / CGMCC3.15140) TaxID=1229662 RepID=W3WU87_PESFW|nr:uncharacterized protein PFICI_11228 [Pestalotiopsis fici W106-1]ETS77354.1 hypothetical protein PFICI_11228 [Pestalotiopsis fici W106-1]